MNMTLTIDFKVITSITSVTSSQLQGLGGDHEHSRMFAERHHATVVIHPLNDNKTVVGNGERAFHFLWRNQSHYDYLEEIPDPDRRPGGNVEPQAKRRRTAERKQPDRQESKPQSTAPRPRLKKTQVKKKYQRGKQATKNLQAPKPAPEPTQDGVPAPEPTKPKRRSKPRAQRKLGGKFDIRVLTANVGASEREFAQALTSQCHILLIQEHRRTRGKLATWQHMAKAAGWEGVWTEAELTKDGGISGGLATLTRAGVSHGKCNVGNTRRLLKTYVQWTANIKFHVYNVYGYDKGHQQRDDENQKLLRALEDWTTAAGRTPWICGGDWNVTPTELTTSANRAFYVHDHGRATYGEDRIIDYFISSRGWGPLLQTGPRRARRPAPAGGTPHPGLREDRAWLQN